MALVQYPADHVELLKAQAQNIRLLQSSRLLQWIFYAIDQDYLIYIAITSQVLGKLKGLGLPFGSGKSHLMLNTMYYVYKILLERDGYLIDTEEKEDYVWNIVFSYIMMRPEAYLPSPLSDERQRVLKEEKRD